MRTYLPVCLRIERIPMREKDICCNDNGYNLAIIVYNDYNDYRYS